MKKIIFILILITTISLTNAQNPEWITYGFYDFYFSDKFMDMAFDREGNAWIATTDGRHGQQGVLVKFDGTNWEKWYKEQTGLPKNLLYDIVIDKKDNIWVGSGFGVLKFDRNTFEIFNTENSPILYNNIKDLAVDSSNIVFISTYFKGGRIETFDGNSWYIYDSTNTPFPNNPYIYCNSLFIDKSNVKWVGYNYDYISKYNNNSWSLYDTLSKLNRYNGIEGLETDSSGNLWIAWEYPVKFDGVNWTILYDSPKRMIFSIAVEKNDILWFSAYYPSDPKSKTGGGLLKYENGNWTVWDSTNSPFVTRPNKILIDKYGNKWMATGIGLQIFREGGVIGINNVEDDKKIEQSKILCYPNPTSGTINLRYRIETAGIANIYLTDVLGNQTLLKSEYKFPGDYVETFDIGGYPQGIYNVVLKMGSVVNSERVLFMK